MVRALVTALMVLTLAPAPAGGNGARVAYVDGDSRGGRCADARSAARAAGSSTPWCSLARALDAVPAGGTVIVRAGRYPAVRISHRHRSRRLTVRAYRDEAVTLGGLSIEDASRLRFEGLRIRGRTHIQFGSHIELIGNDIAGEGISVRPTHDLRIEGNRIHDLTYAGPSGGAGYGLWLNGGWSDPARRQGISNVVVRRNLFDRIPADAIQMGTVESVLIEKNRFTRITPFLDPTEHSDAIQMYGTSKDVTIRRNVFHDTLRGLIAKGFSYPGLVIENNLMVRLRGTALNIYDAPGARIVHNTIWDTPLGLRLRDLPEVPATMDGAVVANNLLQSFEFSRKHVAFEDHNLIGRRLGRQIYGPNDLFAGPRFAGGKRRLGYALRPTSPAIDSGTSRISTSRDRVGRRRLDVRTRRNRGVGQKSYIDLGAHEYRSPPNRSRSPG